MTSEFGRNKGFTIIELIVVMVVTGVLAAVALPRFTDSSIFESRGFRDETLSLLRYAQKAAVAQRRTVCVTLQATGVTLAIVSAANSTNCAATTTLALPAAPRGSTGLTTTAGSLPFTFSFLASGATNRSANLTIAISGSDDITVDWVTGYAY